MGRGVEDCREERRKDRAHLPDARASPERSRGLCAPGPPQSIFGNLKGERGAAENGLAGWLYPQRLWRKPRSGAGEACLGPRQIILWLGFFAKGVENQLIGPKFGLTLRLVLSRQEEGRVDFGQGTH